MAAYRQALCALVQGVQCSEGLSVFIHHLPFQKIKECIMVEIKGIDDQKAREMMMKTCPMDYILPRDCMQSILDFVPDQSTVKLVNKNFNALNLKIGKLSLRGIPSLGEDWKLREQMAQTKMENKRKEIQQLEKNCKATISKLHNQIVTKHRELIKFIKNDMENVMRNDEIDEPDWKYCRECLGLWWKTNMSIIGGCERCHKPVCDEDQSICSYGDEHKTCWPVHLCDECSDGVLEDTPCYHTACKDCMKHHNIHCQRQECVRS